MTAKADKVIKSSKDVLIETRHAAFALGNDPPNGVTTMRALTALHAAADEIERLMQQSETPGRRCHCGRFAFPDEAAAIIDDMARDHCLDECDGFPVQRATLDCTCGAEINGGTIHTKECGHRPVETSAPINQCDGCRRGLPLNERGVHVGPGGFWSGDVQGCTSHLYTQSKARGDQP